MGEEAATPLLVPGNDGDDPRLDLTLGIHGDDDQRKAAGEAPGLPPASAAARHALLGLDWAEVTGQLGFAAPMVATSMAYYAIPLVSVMFAGRLGDLQLQQLLGHRHRHRAHDRAERLAGDAVRARIRRSGVPDDGRAPAGVAAHLRAGLRRRLPPLALLGAAARVPRPGPGDVAPGRRLPPPLGASPVCLRLHPVRAPVPAGAVRGGAARRLLAAPARSARRRRARARQRARHGVHRLCRGNLRLALDVVPHARGVRHVVSTSIIAMCQKTEAISYMISYGFAAVISTRVSNELGARNIANAKKALKVSLALSLMLGVAFLLLLGLGHEVWVSSEAVVIHDAAAHRLRGAGPGLHAGGAVRRRQRLRVASTWRPGPTWSSACPSPSSLASRLGSKPRGCGWGRYAASSARTASSSSSPCEPTGRS